VKKIDTLHNNFFEKMGDIHKKWNVLILIIHKMEVNNFAEFKEILVLLVLNVALAYA
jgi:hypothetical protein